MEIAALRFGWMQVATGFFLIAMAAWLRGFGWLFAWPGLSVGIVGLGYLGLGPGVFGKKPDGTLGPLHLMLLLPYHAMAWARVQWDAIVAREDPWNEVAPHVFLGRIGRAKYLPPGTRVIVDLTSEFAIPASLRRGREYHCLPALDTSVPRYESFAHLARALATRADTIFICCAAGHGRSATFAAALLIARGMATDAEEAEHLLRRARPGVRLHRIQQEWVGRFASDLVREHGTES